MAGRLDHAPLVRLSSDCWVFASVAKYAPSASMTARDTKPAGIPLPPPGRARAVRPLLPAWVLSALLLAWPARSVAAPAPHVLMVDPHTSQCLLYWAGDGHTRFRLPAGEWVRLDQRPPDQRACKKAVAVLRKKAPDQAKHVEYQGTPCETLFGAQHLLQPVESEVCNAFGYNRQCGKRSERLGGGCAACSTSRTRPGGSGAWCALLAPLALAFRRRRAPGTTVRKFVPGLRRLDTWGEGPVQTRRGTRPNCPIDLESATTARNEPPGCRTGCGWRRGRWVLALALVGGTTCASCRTPCEPPKAIWVPLPDDPCRRPPSERHLLLGPAGGSTWATARIGIQHFSLSVHVPSAGSPPNTLSGAHLRVGLPSRMDPDTGRYPTERVDGRELSVLVLDLRQYRDGRSEPDTQLEFRLPQSGSEQRLIVIPGRSGETLGTLEVLAGGRGFRLFDAAGAWGVVARLPLESSPSIQGSSLDAAASPDGAPNEVVFSQSVSIECGRGADLLVEVLAPPGTAPLNVRETVQP